VRFVIPIVFIALAAWFALDARAGHSLPIPPPSGVAEADLELGPPRQALELPPAIQNGPFRQTCSECHDIFPSPELPRTPLIQHTHIVLDHGLNDRCYNCHAREDRDRLALYDGTTIGFEDVPRLCAQCHGPAWRDWQHGTHGRTSGFWDVTRGERVRLACTQCHDPHAPAFPAYAPLPGPNTLRMGHPSTGEEHDEPVNPLEKWKAHLHADEGFRAERHAEESR
jgi:hypothetical protein